MNWDYISGFFDADGSITFAKAGNSKNKTISITFTNVHKEILIEIKEFIKIKLDINGFISRKPAKRKGHMTSYQLQYVYFSKCIPLMEKINTKHPIKKHRFEIADKLYDYTPRNGKYSKFQKEMRINLEKELFK
jgi:intein/homing endonuclease